MLMQGGHPIAFESRKLLPHERLCSIYDKEMLAIMHALAKFGQYLVGNRYKGKNNVAADALSRRPATLSLMSLDTDWRARLLVEYSKDRFACEVLDGQVVDDRYRVVVEIIYYRDRIFFTEGSQLKKKILQASHGSPLAGHRGFTKTYRTIRGRFSWKGLKEDVL
eukprot:PITA_23806